ncbi:MAG: flagellin [Burkholderiaceae bacterium]|nr:MAG: flagellin [Burkholderiaceae bacterium]
MLNVNTNVPSLNAQRNLSMTGSAIATSLQRLSSGLRVNSAKDDAAGLAIADRMTSQIHGLNQAARNANDAISLSQTAEGDLAQIGNNLQRIRELAVQAANASNSSTDRVSLNNEASQLISEIDRVASASSFNGVKLLDGTFSAQTFQVGANNTSNDRISISSIASARTAALGVGSGSSYSTAITTGAVSASALAAGDITINGYNVGATTSDGVSSAQSTASAIAKAAAVNAISGNTGVTATIVATSIAYTATAGGSDTTGATVNGVSLGASGVVALSTNASAAASEMAAAINAVSTQTGVTATVSGASYTLTATDGRNITIAATAGDSGLSAATTRGGLVLNSTSSGGITIGGSGFAALGGSVTVGNTAATATVGAGVSSLDLTTASGAQNALATIDSALATVNSSRAALGAYQNRFTSAISSLQTTAENLSASRSRIQDADFAAETAALTRAQVLQQAGTAMLAQANALPNNVLTLLRG